MLLCGEFDGGMFLQELTDRKERGERRARWSQTGVHPEAHLVSLMWFFMFFPCSHPFSATKQVFPSLHTVLSHLVWLEEKMIFFFCLSADLV